MKILVVEPVVLELFESDVAYLDAIKQPDTVVECVSLAAGPTSIETYFDEAFALAEVLRLIEANVEGADAVVINCFADPALMAARELLDIPVVGASEASMSLALQLARRFGVVSTYENSVAYTELQARARGIETRLAGVIGIELGVCELEEDIEATTRLLIDAARELIATRRAEAIVLGCTGMVPAASGLRAALDVPVIEPLAAAFKTAETMVTLGLAHAHGGQYRRPDASKLRG